MVCAPVRRDNPRALASAQTMLYLTCTTITSVELAHYGVSRARDWVSVDCGTSLFKKTTTTFFHGNGKVTIRKDKNEALAFFALLSG